MKRYFFVGLLLSVTMLLRAAETSFIKEMFEVVSGELKLSFMVGDDKRLYQLGFGNVADSVRVPKKMPSRESEFFPPYGNGVLTEPALQATHADGNTSTELCYEGRRVENLEEGVTQTVISLADPVYPFEVDIYIKCYE